MGRSAAGCLMILGPSPGQPESVTGRHYGGQPRPMAEPWNGMPRNPSAIRAIAAIRHAICAGHAMRAREQAPRNAPLASCASFWPRTARRDVAGRRWVISKPAPIHADPPRPRNEYPRCSPRLSVSPRLGWRRLSTASLLHPLVHRSRPQHGPADPYVNPVRSASQRLEHEKNVFGSAPSPAKL